MRGLVALGLLVALIAGIPWALWHFIGWPLPHHVPSIGQVGHALNQRGIPDQALVDALAVVVWITWAVLVASIVVEVPAALSGRHAPRLPLAGIFQPVTGRLVAAVIVAALTLAPRPAHASPSGSLSGNPSSSTVRQPVAALLLKDTALNDPVPIDPAFKDAVLARATHPLPTRPPSPDPIATRSGATPSGAPVATQPAGSPSTYVVQRGDTLWGIAERQLGDPLEWQAIYQLNEGRSQPDGATLTDPHWIDPGWTLLLPAATSAPTAAPASRPPLTTPTSPTTEPPATTLPPTTVPPTTTPGPAIRAIPATPTPATGTGPVRASHASEPVRLPSGSVVASSFAAGVLSAVALGRLRRRHAYRYRPPEPGRNLGPDPLPPTLRHLATVVWAQENSSDPGTAAEAPAMADDNVEHRERPDVIDIGTRDGEPVSMALSDMAGITLGGPDADDVVRAWIAALMVRAGPIAAEVLTTQAVLDRLVPGVGPAFGNSTDSRMVAVPGLRTVPDAETVLRALESEVLARTRHLDADEVADVVAYRQANPWEPVPTIVAVLEAIPADKAARWEPTLAAGARLGLGVIVLDPDGATRVRLDLDPERLVVSAAPDHLASRLVGVRLFGLASTEALDVLTTLAETERRPDSEDEGAAWIEQVDGRPVSAVVAEVASAPEPWPDNPPVAGTTDTPITVRLLGPYEIHVGDQPVATGLRSAAKELFAWYLLRPEGATIEAAVDALWPDTDPARVHKQFWTGAANLRTRLGTTSEPATKVLIQTGEIYRLDADAIGCDLWQLQAALRDAAHSGTDTRARDALRRAVEVCGGDLVQGADYRWVEPVRQDLHRRVLDAHLRLAELEEQLGAPDAAEAVLERAVELDRYAEEPYRRLLSLHGRRRRPEAVETTFRLLQRRLEEIDVDPEPATLRLHRSLTAPDTMPTNGPRPRRLSS
ncbi:MAG: BTAD domain-containing putative transcriptional regulator [Actinomycetota bacterium]|nr:BTAD domain-containing putative transcriptional regulator [Actinomycetota bacterium]